MSACEQGTVSVVNELLQYDAEVEILDAVGIKRRYD